MHRFLFFCALILFGSYADLTAGNPENEALIRDFYTHFQNLEAKGMHASYHANVIFEDPAFGKLHGQDAKDMWSMLCAADNDLRIEFSDISANDSTGTAHWEAWYKFGEKERPVHNVIDAKFRFQDGKIIHHQDDFDLHKWAGQALGFSGKLLGGTKFFRRTLQKKTKTLLAEYQEEQKKA